MASSLVLVALAAAGAVQAAVTPTAPGPGDKFNEGSSCTLQYTPDSTGTWKNMTIQLMTGSNQAMVPLMNVLTNYDGTTSGGASGTYSYPCPEVSPNAPIYFYQFTNNGLNPTWTTRFTIADASGNSVAAPQTERVSGQSVGWGIGSIVGDATSASSASGSAASGSATASADASSATDSGSSSSSSDDSSASATSAAASSASSGASSGSTGSSSGASGSSSGSGSGSGSGSSSSSSTSGAMDGAKVGGTHVVGMIACGVAALMAVFL